MFSKSQSLQLALSLVVFSLAEQYFLHFPSASSVFTFWFSHTVPWCITHNISVDWYSETTELTSCLVWFSYRSNPDLAHQCMLLINLTNSHQHQGWNTGQQSNECFNSSRVPKITSFYMGITQFTQWQTQYSIYYDADWASNLHRNLSAVISSPSQVVQ